MKMKRAYLSVVMVTMIAALGVGVIDAASNERQNATPQDVFDGMRKSFRAERAKNLHVRYQFNLSGTNGGEWFIEVTDGRFKMDRGKIANPDVTFVASDKDWVACSNNTLSGTWAFMTGRLKIRGDHGLAKKLDEIFP